jgi:Fibronectin type III domain
MWAVLAAIVVLAGLAGGLAVWAPWRSTPLLRPAGLAAGPSTTTSVSFHWSGPATGPAPGKYVILYGGTVIGSVPGTVTSYRSTGLYPDTPYVYQVAAVRGGKRSAPSAVVVLRTSAPPLSAARWQGPWTVRVRIVRGGAALRGPRPLQWDESWQVSPQCAAGPCAVRLSGTFNGYGFKATLHRAGAVYTGTTTANSFRCGPRSNKVPTRSTLKIRVVLTQAQGDSGAWAASSWAGTLRASAAYTSSSTFYCNPFHVTASLSGN